MAKIPPLETASRAAAARRGHPAGNPLRRRAALGAALATALAAGCGAPRDHPRPRNLIIVCVDTLRADHVGAYGSARATTPVLDGLAADGVRFDTAWSTSNWTVPAVASLLTGRSPLVHGATLGEGVLHLGVAPEAPFGIRPDLPLLAEVLRERGFATALYSGNPYLYGRFKDGFSPARVERSDAAAHLAEIRRWLESGPGERFFLYWQIMDLHQPIDPPREMARRFAPDAPEEFPTRAQSNWSFGSLESDEDPAFREYRRLKVALYDGALLHVDRMLGELRSILDETGRAGDTLLVVTADHGEEFWDHWREEREKRSDPRGLWGIGHGHAMYEELLRVPLVFAGPSIPAGETVSCPVSLVDLFPTVLDLLGLGPLPTPLDGRSLRPDLEDPNAPCPARDLIAEAPAYGPNAASIRRGRWKLIREEHQPPVLFDLETDSAETSNSAASHPRIVESLGHFLAARHAAGAPGGEPVEPLLDEELRRDLRALGYLN